MLTTFTTTSIRIFGKFNNEAKDRGAVSRPYPRKNTNPQAWQEFSNYLQLNEKDTFSLLLVAIEQLEQLFNPTIQMNSIGHQLNHILEGYRQKLLPFLHKLALFYY